MTDQAGDPHKRRIEAITNSLSRAFGDRAIEVARKQAELAGSEGAVAWKAVVDSLTSKG